MTSRNRPISLTFANVSNDASNVQCSSGRSTCSGITTVCQPEDDCLPTIGLVEYQDDNSCDNNFMMQCSGFSPSIGTDIDSVISFWDQRQTISGNTYGTSCKNYYTAYLNNTETDPSASGLITCASQFNSDRYEDVNNYINNLFTLYTDKYIFTDDTTDPLYNSFQITLSDLCGGDSPPPSQGGCNQFLSKYCTQYSRNQIASQRILLQLCGCYAPLDNISGVTDDPESRSCDSLCHQVGTTQLYDAATGGQFVCNASVCVIGDTTIIAAQTEIGGSVTFQQICPGCSPSQPCKCVITNVTVTGIDTEELESSINSSCGDSECYFINPDGTSTSVPCSSLESPPVPFYQTPLFITIITLVIVGFLIFVIIVLVMVNGKSKRMVSVISPEERDKNSIVSEAVAANASVKGI
jgi:hypothetical protein